MPKAHSLREREGGTGREAEPVEALELGWPLGVVSFFVPSPGKGTHLCFASLDLSCLGEGLSNLGVKQLPFVEGKS